MDYFTPFDSLTLRGFKAPETYAAEGSPSVSYSSLRYALRGKSQYAASWSKKCNTALATQVAVIGAENQRLSRIDTTLMGDGTEIKTLVIPKGAKLSIQAIPMDTGLKDSDLDFGWTSINKWVGDGFTQDYHIADEDSVSHTGAGGVDVYRQYYNYPNLALLAVAESKRQHPEWYTNDDVSVETFFSNLDKIYADVSHQMLSIAQSNYTTLQTLEAKDTILTNDGSDNSSIDPQVNTFNKEGSYLLTMRYGYDANATRDNDWYSYKAGFWNYATRGILEVGSIVVGGWLAKGLIKGALGIRGALKGGASMLAVARTAGVSSVRYGATAALVETALLGGELLAWTSPWLSPMFTGATLSNNSCDFPANGHVHNFEVRVYDPAKTDSYGNAACPTGQHKPLIQRVPPRYADVPCCPQNSTYEPSSGLCKNPDGSTADPTLPNGKSGENVRWLLDNTEGSPQIRLEIWAALGLAGLFLYSRLKR